MEASPYPSAVVIRGLAPSSVKLTGKPFYYSGLSWLSYSQPSHFSTVPGLVGPVSPVTKLKAPHAGQVARSIVMDQSPLHGITQPADCLTHFDRWRPCTVRTAQGVSASPSLHLLHRIECRDYSEENKRLPDKGRCSSCIRISPTSLRRAQRTPLDVPRSTGQPHNEWLVHSLSRTGEVRFTGCGCLSMIVMRATSGRAFFCARFEAARFIETTAAIRYPIPDH